jgi:predicted DNA-binding ribbon-helix-helix protein
MTQHPFSNIKHSVTINGHRTSVTLELIFWQSFKDIAALRGISVNALIADIDRQQPGNLSSALRVFVLEFYLGLAAQSPLSSSR